MNFTQMKVPFLKKYLQDRGVTCYLYKKEQLVRLCVVAEEMELEVLNKSDQEISDEYGLQDMARRRVLIDGQEVILDDVTKIMGWSKNLMSLPDLESADIMVYLYKECGWGEQRLKNYKADNGYQLYLANHISNVEMCNMKENAYTYVRGNCIPETRQNKDPYHTWILLASNGGVHSGGCTCVADDGTCKHCVALLFGIRSFLDRHRDRHSESCTDVECVWDKPRKKSEPIEILDIDIRKDQSTSASNLVPTLMNYHPVGKTEHNLGLRGIEKELYMLVKNDNPLLLQTLDPPSDESSDDESLSLPTLQQAVQSTPINESITQHLQSFFNENVIREIEVATRGQSNNEAWYEHRQGRITASVFSSVMHFRYTSKPNNYILKLVMGKGNETNALSLLFGKSHEPIARNIYFQETKKQHRSFNVNQCGLFVDKNYPYIGASPDGVVTCSCCGQGLLEIKCSYTYQNDYPNKACEDNNYHVYCDENNNLRLKCSSPWYVQIQGQMGVTKLKWCDFVFYTKKGIAIDRITFDPEMYDEITRKCKRFFETYVLKSLL